MFSTDTDYELNIPNYLLILPNTMKNLNNCRIAALVREDIEVKVLNQFMNDKYLDEDFLQR